MSTPPYTERQQEVIRKVQEFFEASKTFTLTPPRWKNWPGCSPG